MITPPESAHSHSPSSPPPPPRPAREAWQRHVVGRPSMPHGWADWAERFVREAQPEEPLPTLAVLLLCLDNARSWQGLVDGDWITLCTTHRYLYFEGRGYGDRRTLTLVEQFVHWLYGLGAVSREELCRLVNHVEGARQASGIARVHGSVYR